MPSLHKTPCKLSVHGKRSRLLCNVEEQPKLLIAVETDLEPKHEKLEPKRQRRDLSAGTFCVIPKPNKAAIVFAQNQLDRPCASTSHVSD